MRFFLSVALLLACTLNAFADNPAALDSDVLSRQLAEHSPACGAFEQRQWLADFEMELASTGSFERRNDGLNWRTETPVQTEILLGDDNPELPSGYRLLLPILTGVLSGDWQRLSDHFRIDTRGELAAWRAELVPVDNQIAARLPLIRLQGGQFVEHIDLHFADEDRLQLSISPAPCPAEPSP
jgi:hypothetical protein